MRPGWCHLQSIPRIGVTGFEPATSWSQTTPSSQTELHSEIKIKFNCSISTYIMSENIFFRLFYLFLHNIKLFLCQIAVTGVEPAYPALWGQCVSSSTPHRSRDGRIRTHDFLVPGQALYQTEPRPDIMEHMGIEPIWISCVQNRRPPLAVPHPIFFSTERGIRTLKICALNTACIPFHHFGLLHTILVC